MLSILRAGTHHDALSGTSGIHPTRIGWQAQHSSRVRSLHADTGSGHRPCCPIAYNPPTMEPMLVPTTISIGTPDFSTYFNTPTAEAPFAPPPPNTNATLGRTSFSSAESFVSCAITAPHTDSNRTKMSHFLIFSFFVCKDTKNS